MAQGPAAAEEAANRFLHSLSRALQLMRLYEPTSPHLDEPIQALARSLAGMVEEAGGFAFEGRDSAVIANGAPLRGEGSPHQNLLEMLSRRGVGGISFRGALDEVEWAQLLSEIARTSRSSETPCVDLAAALKRRGLDRVELIAGTPGTVLVRTPTRRVEPRIFAVRTIAKATVLLGQYVEGLGSPAKQSYLHIKLQRILQDLVTVCAEGAWKFVGVVNNKPGEKYLYEHGVNVAVIALAVGARIGLRRSTLAELGMAALLHDIGKALMPEGLIHKEGRFTPEERDALKASPARGVRALLQEGQFNEGLLRRILVVCEHQDPAERPRHPFSELIGLSERLDALMSPRRYRTALLPDEAIRLVAGREEFDPDFRRALVWTLGLYPPGTFLQLASGAIAVAFHPHSNPAHLRMPVVRMVRDAEGKECAKAPVVDLATSSERVVRALSAATVGSGAPRFLARPVEREAPIAD